MFGEREPDPFEVCEAEVIRTSDKAIQVQAEDEDFWIPKSVVLDDVLSEEGDEGSLVVHRWWARKNRHIGTVDEALREDGE